MKCLGLDVATARSCAGAASWACPPSPDGSISHEDGQPHHWTSPWVQVAQFDRDCGGV